MNIQSLGNFSQSSYFWPLVIWSMIWKGVALWRAGTTRDKWWFLAIFLINTFGILDIFYIFIWNKRERGTDKAEIKTESGGNSV